MMWAELEQRLVVIKADKTLCAICGKKYPDPAKCEHMRFDVIGKPSRRTCVRVEIHSEPYLRHGAFAAMNAHYSRDLLSRWTFMLKPNVTNCSDKSIDCEQFTYLL